MKSHSLTTSLLALLLSPGAVLAASDSLNLTANVFVLSRSEVRDITVLGSTQAGGTNGLTFGSPVVVQFDRETLSLDGATFSWSGGHNPPKHFSLIGTPSFALNDGKAITLLSSVPVQYFEKLGNGDLRVREIPADSPDAPHFRLTFQTGPQSAGTGELRLACEVDIATVGTRESVPGVALKVGKPVLAPFKDRVEVALRPGEWSALMLQAPNASDYCLLVLIKVAPSDAPAAVTGAAPMKRPLSALELDTFAVTYYLHPRPELIAPAIEALGPSGYLKERAPVFVGFFAEVFSANPTRVDTWQSLIARQDKRARQALESALALARAGDVLATRAPETELVARCWGAFFASGDPAYVRNLVGQLPLVDDTNPLTSTAGTKALKSLWRNARQHPAVRSILETIRQDSAPRTRELIDQVLDRDLLVLEQRPESDFSPFDAGYRSIHSRWLGGQPVAPGRP